MMNLLSLEAERELLERIDSHLEKRLELEIERLDNFDLIPREEVKKKLGVSTQTLNKWEKVGLKQYASPFENSKKIYYRKSDLYNFLSIN